MSDLLKINVNDHTEKKNGLTYLSWAWAWAEVLKIDPDAEWEPVEYWLSDPRDKTAGHIPCAYMPQPDGTGIVKVKVTIKGKTKLAILPVMDHRNKAIENPNAFQVNTAIQRCLAKAIAMHGLGLYIYAGEDLPEDATRQEPANDEGPVSADRLAELQEIAADMLQLAAEDRGMEAVRAYYELPTNDEKMALWGMLRGEGKGSTPESRLRALIKSNSPHAVA